MTVTAELWTCPECEVTEQLDPAGHLGEQRLLVQLGHTERHRAERRRAGPIAGALVDAIEALAAMRVRLVVSPGDLERVRELVKRRGVAIEVFAGDVPDGRGYVMTPRRGVRELPSTGGDNPGDGAP